MAAGTAMAVAGLAASAASSGMSFYQASQQRNLQIKAQEAARRAIAEARKKLEVNYFDALSLPKEPYQLEREALLSSGAQAMEAARESQRGVAATAGRLQMAQNEQQGQVRTAMNRDLMGLEAKSAAEDSRLAGELSRISQEETAGAQTAAANAWALEQRALQQGFAGVTRMVAQGAKMFPYTGKDANINTGKNPVSGVGTDLAMGAVTGGVGGVSSTPSVQGVGNSGIDFAQPPPTELNGKMLNPSFQGKSINDIILMLQEQGNLSPNMGEIDYAQLFNTIYQ
jgi:hypothetical protein